MNTPRILIVFFSRSGVTRSIALALAKLLDADVEQITEARGRAGPFGYLRSLVEALKQRPANIEPPTRNVGSYDLVVIGTPIWAASVSSPVRAYLAMNRAGLPQIAFFCSLGGRGSESAFEQMRVLSGRTLLAECAITAREAQHGEHSDRIAEYATRLRSRVAQS
jgi:flavodoxin